MLFCYFGAIVAFCSIITVIINIIIIFRILNIKHILLRVFTYSSLSKTTSLRKDEAVIHSSIFIPYSKGEGGAIKRDR